MQIGAESVSYFLFFFFLQKCLFDTHYQGVFGVEDAHGGIADRDDKGSGEDEPGREEVPRRYSEVQ